MESWRDQGIVLSARAHGENGAIVSLLTEQQGRFAGYVRGAQSSKMRGCLEVGSVVDVEWNARVSDSLGTFKLELVKSYSARNMSDPLRLNAIKAACSLCHEGLPEREKHEGLYHGLLAMFDTLDEDIWKAAYIMWEIAFLKELGFSLDLTRCAGGGDSESLAYVSPKTGRAVSLAQGAPYKGKLLTLPEFLKPSGNYDEEQDFHTGLKLTGYFLQNWAFAHHTQGLPAQRVQLEAA